MTKLRTLSALMGGIAAVSVLATGALAEDAWYPLEVEAIKAGATERAPAAYSPLSATEKASKNWQICVSLPHMKDPFFLAMNYGMVEEAKLLGVDVQTLDAGGYDKLANQISQIENCVAGGADAVVMVAVSQDGMDNLLGELKQKGIPVIDAINGVSSRDTAARVLTSPYDEGLRAGQYLAAKHPAGSETANVGWLPGPAGAGFVTAFDSGFQKGIEGSAIKVVETKHGDVGKEIQAALVEDMLQTHDDIDYVVGTAVMVEGALPLLRAKGVQDKVKLVSVYTTPGVHASLKAGQIEAAGAAPVVLTSRVILDTAVRVLENKVEFTDVGTLGKVYTVDTIGELDPLAVMAPARYAPVFSLDQ
ncbi:TMAO reductase system periplasmic protein TorT [Ruixingdingia sedimenti]|uniref:TMAO reductase system periplasmic protein TorT n=1 Tax=Ruixingdingia sedimenti TaxID=3073604 RepID=A0ABU1F6C2_9RHOB|nr:TMAO reductase system periplasmic protein TorT [Xinfangfangia sp. LG-4]MDR5652425.1 TMAO reductase system periplasmic protein TorT [Xinfangfangia sp. LG-4]